MLGENIVTVSDARDRLRAIFKGIFKNATAEFEIGIDPNNGRYTIVAFVNKTVHYAALPKEIDGYNILPTMQALSSKKRETK